MPKKIHVLEDDEAIRDIVSMILSEEDYEVETYKSVTDFMQRDHHQKADLFLLDVMLPDGNGIEVCSLLKNDETTRHIPVIMMSANSNKAKVENSCSAEAFVAKPFDIYYLLDTVANSLQNAKWNI